MRAIVVAASVVFRTAPENPEARAALTWLFARVPQFEESRRQTERLWLNDGGQKERCRV